MEDKKKDRLQLEESSESSDCGEGKDRADKKLDKKKLVYLFSTVGLSAFFCAFYYCSMELSAQNSALYYFFPAVMVVYMAALIALLTAYMIYNRGFSRKGITLDMLPAEWSEEKRRAFIESGEKRFERSKWILVFIIALLFTFLAESVTLFVIPVFKGFFG